MGFRTAAAALALAMSLASTSLDAQSRAGTAQGRTGGGRQMPREGVGPRQIQAQFDAYMIGQAETVLRITEEQYPQFVRRARAVQALRRQSRVQRNRLLAQLNQMLRARPAVDHPRLTAATQAIDEHDRQTLDRIQKAYAAVDEVLTPWQRGRFRVLEDQLEQKKIDMLLRARQGPRR